jgi:hypothetical protein
VNIKNNKTQHAPPLRYAAPITPINSTFGAYFGMPKHKGDPFDLESLDLGLQTGVCSHAWARMGPHGLRMPHGPHGARMGPHGPAWARMGPHGPHGPAWA